MVVAITCAAASPVLNVLGAELRPLTPAGLEVFQTSAGAATGPLGGLATAGTRMYPNLSCRFAGRRLHRAFDAHAAGCCGPSARHSRPFGIKFSRTSGGVCSPPPFSRRSGTPELVGRQPLNPQPVREMAR